MLIFYISIYEYQMLNQYVYLLYASLLGLITGCVGVRATVKTDFDKNVDFSKFKTFYWVKGYRK